jgi:hypothetical protein
LIVVVIISEVDARNGTVTVLDSLLLVNMHVEKAEENALHETLIERETHARLFLLRRPSFVGCGWAPVTNDIRMHESILYHPGGGIALEHHASESNANCLHATLDHAKSVMSVRRAELVFEASLTAVLNPCVRSVHELVISATACNPPRLELVLKEGSEFDPVYKYFAL